MANFEAGSTPEIFGKITRKNLDSIRRDYGDGSSGEGREYHNELHTLGVMKGVKTMTSLWNKQFPDDPITARDEHLLEIAASGHDRVVDAAKRLQDFKPGDNERLSADEVEKDMRDAGGYSEKDITFVRSCILGTIPEFGPDRLSQPMTDTRKMHESGEITDYQFELAKLLADADLASFGQGYDAFSEWALRLFKEMKKDPGDFQAYVRYEISVLENHSWVSKVGADAFPHKQESIDALKKLLEKNTTIA
jgi:predicted metal-dependent HD superfamily phosphohydrolase